MKCSFIYFMQFCKLILLLTFSFLFFILFYLPIDITVTVYFIIQNIKHKNKENINANKLREYQKQDFKTVETIIKLGIMMKI